jgi:hypothetical protein
MFLHDQGMRTMANPWDARIKLLNAVDDGAFCTLDVLPSGHLA